MHQILFRIPIRPFDWLPDWWPHALPIYGYGMMLFVAFVVCSWLAGRRAQSLGIRREAIQDLAIWLFVGGLLGSRIVYLYYERDWKWSEIGDFLLELPQIWNGGVVFFGGAIGGTIAFLLVYQVVFRKHKVSIWKLADVCRAV